MGRNARLQNEINAHLIRVEILGTDSLERMGGSMDILVNIESKTKTELQQLDEMCKEHPTLSERYKTYYRNYILTRNAYMLMQGLYLALHYELPEQYSKAVKEHYWEKMQEPYTMIADDFSHFFRDYSLNLEIVAQNKNHYPIKWIMERAERDGIIRLSNQDREAIKQYDLAYPAYWEKWKNTPDSLHQALNDEFEKNDFMVVINEIISREGYEEYASKQFMKRNIELFLKELEAQGWSQSAHDLYLCRHLCKYIDWSQKALDKEILDLADANIYLQGAKNAVHTLSDRYEAISKRLLKYDNLKSNDVVKGMTDGELILRKIIEPYKGKIVILDVWGTWCGPCKERLSHAQEEYERLKDLDIVYIYLANNSENESWKNVIKHFNVTGPNVVHYNLPADQQKAVEDFIGVEGYPTYKLIDRQGNINDLDWRHADNLNAFAKQLERMP
jgi:thiol-disulfide isomerase/thioredoxin